MEEKEEIKCDDCGTNMAEWICLECRDKAYQCQNCNEYLHDFPPMKHHKPIPLVETDQRVCKQHSQWISEYCDFCKRKCCPSCAYFEHHKHEVQNVDAYIEKVMQPAIKRMREEMEKSLTEVAPVIDGLHRANKRLNAVQGDLEELLKVIDEALQSEDFDPNHPTLRSKELIKHKCNEVQLHSQRCISLSTEIPATPNASELSSSFEFHGNLNRLNSVICMSRVKTACMIKGTNNFLCVDKKDGALVIVNHAENTGSRLNRSETWNILDIHCTRDACYLLTSVNKHLVRLPFNSTDSPIGTNIDDGILEAADEIIKSKSEYWVPIYASIGGILGEAQAKNTIPETLIYYLLGTPTDIWKCTLGLDGDVALEPPSDLSKVPHKLVMTENGYLCYIEGASVHIKKALPLRADDTGDHVINIPSTHKIIALATAGSKLYGLFSLADSKEYDKIVAPIRWLDQMEITQGATGIGFSYALEDTVNLPNHAIRRFEVDEDKKRVMIIANNILHCFILVHEKEALLFNSSPFGKEERKK